MRLRDQPHWYWRMQPRAHLLSLYLQNAGHQQKQPVSYLQSTIDLIQLTLKTILIMPEFRPFESVKSEIIPDKLFGDIFYVSEEGRLAF